MKQLILIAVIASVTSTMGFGKKFDVKKDIQFDLYTLTNPTTAQVLTIDNITSIDESNFNPDLPTRFFIHGFQARGKLKKALTDAYFTKGNKDINLIGVNWEKASETFNYLAAAGYVEKIGNYTAQFIDFMADNQVIDLSELTVIGFSLGAHCAGIAGKRVRSGKIGKIVGLDPASPLFSMDEPDKRLTSEDALYVETVHTSKLGMFDPLGTVSIYFNGGRSQPQCVLDIVFRCSHQAAYKYFAESIYSDEPLVGYMCDSLDDIKSRNCTANGREITIGGEPGAWQQPAGVYHISTVEEEEAEATNEMKNDAIINPFGFLD